MGEHVDCPKCGGITTAPTLALRGTCYGCSDRKEVGPNAPPRPAFVRYGEMIIGPFAFLYGCLCCGVFLTGAAAGRWGIAWAALKLLVGCFTFELEWGTWPTIVFAVWVGVMVLGAVVVCIDMLRGRTTRPD